MANLEEVKKLNIVVNVCNCKFPELANFIGHPICKICNRPIYLEKTNNKEKEAFLALAKEMHKDHGCAGSLHFETCTAEICVMARSVGGLTMRAADVCPSCSGEGEYIGNDGLKWICAACDGTGQRR